MDHKKISDAISNLREKLRNLPDDNHRSLESWLVDFKELELLLLKYGPSSPIETHPESRQIQGSRILYNILNSRGCNNSTFSDQTYAGPLQSLQGFARACGVLAKTTYSISVRLKLGRLSRPFTRKSLSKLTLGEKFAQSRDPRSWAPVRVFREHLLQTCLSFVFLICLEGAN